MSTCGDTHAVSSDACPQMYANVSSWVKGSPPVTPGGVICLEMIKWGSTVATATVLERISYIAAFYEPKKDV